MLRPIYIVSNEKELDYLIEAANNHEKPKNRFTGWYGLNRLRAEGPYEPIIVTKDGPKYLPNEGPLANTEIDYPFLWCAISEGTLVVADKKNRDDPPPLSHENMKAKGYYDLEQESNKMIWHPIGAPWDENEISEYKVLSNISYRLYKRVPKRPEHVFFFGAGASRGSDENDLYERDLLPPLGNKLYAKLRDDPELKYWKKIPPEIEELFVSRTFEEGMEALDENEEEKTYALARDLEVSLFFSKYHAVPSNLYCKLGRKISEQLKIKGWSGAAVTLNYDRLLEESFINNQLLFTVVKGVTDYEPGHVLPHRSNELFEVCYPHGGCQFFLANTMFEGFEDGGLIFGPEGGVAGNVGAIHFLNYENIPIAREKNYFPLICRYHPTKRASVNSYFINTQKDRSKELILNAKIVTIIGVQCLYRNDEHIWNPLASTKAFLVYVEPSEAGQNQFRLWANECAKVEGKDFKIIPKTFKDAFEEILKLNDL